MARPKKLSPYDLRFKPDVNTYRNFWIEYINARPYRYKARLIALINDACDAEIAHRKAGKGDDGFTGKLQEIVNGSLYGLKKDLKISSKEYDFKGKLDGKLQRIESKSNQSDYSPIEVAATVEGGGYIIFGFIYCYEHNGSGDHCYHSRIRYGKASEVFKFWESIKMGSYQYDSRGVKVYRIKPNETHARLWDQAEQFPEFRPLNLDK